MERNVFGLFKAASTGLTYNWTVNSQRRHGDVVVCERDIVDIDHKCGGSVSPRKCWCKLLPYASIKEHLIALPFVN